MSPDADVRPAAPRSLRWLGPCGAIALLLSAALYGRTLDYAFAMDDHHFIAENSAVTQGAPLADYFRDPTTVSSEAVYQRQMWRPLRTLLYRAVAALGGVRPALYRALSILLFALIAMATLVLAWRLTGDRWAAAAAALLWLVAPVHVEPVVFASALGDLAALALELAALLAGLRAIAGARPLGWGALSSLLLAASLLTKEMGVSEVARLALVAAALGGFSAVRRSRAWALLGSHGAITIAYVALRTHVLGSVGQFPVSAASFIRGIISAPLLLGHYLLVTIAPFDHTPAYENPPTPSVLVALAGAVVLIAALALAARSRRPALWVGAAWFVLALGPVLQLVPIAGSFADRYALGASMGIAIMIAGGFSALPSRWRRVAGVATGALAATLGAASFVQASMWRSESVLWRTAVELQPRSSLAHGNLGAIFFFEGRLPEAVTEFERAEALGQLQPRLEVRRAMALEALGRRDDELALLVRDAARLDGFGEGQALLGALLARRGDLDGARRALAQAKAQAPRAAVTRTLDAELALRDGHSAHAAEVYARLAEGAPDSVRFRYLAARASLESGDAAGPAAQARACLRLAEAQAQCLGLLGRALLLEGDRGPEARQALERARSGLPPGSERDACDAALASLAASSR